MPRQPRLDSPGLLQHVMPARWNSVWTAKRIQPGHGGLNALRSSATIRTTNVLCGAPHNKLFVTKVEDRKESVLGKLSKMY